MIFAIGALLVLVFVWAKGGYEERLVGSALVLDFYLTGFFYRQGDGNWLEPQWSILIADLLALLALLYTALRSKRFWPLPIAALQFLVILTPLVALFGKNMVSYGLGMTQGIWGYLQLAILVIAAKRHQERMAAVSAK